MLIERREGKRLISKDDSESVWGPLDLLFKELVEAQISLASLPLFPYEQAEAFYQRALAIWEQRLGTEHPLAAHPLQGLAELAQHQGKDEQAETLYQRAFHIREQSLGATHPKTENTRLAYSAFLRARNHA